MSTYIKDPNSKLDYGFNWGKWLDVHGDTISESSWAVDTGLTKGAVGCDGREAFVWLTGGTLGAEYKAVNHIKTVGGREDERTVTIKMRNK